MSKQIRSQLEACISLANADTELLKSTTSYYGYLGYFFSAGFFCCDKHRQII